MRHAFARLLLVSVLAAGALLPAAARAQVARIGIPPATDCTGEPISATEIVSALAAPSTEDPDAMPMIGIAETDLPAGQPADPAQADAAAAEVWAAVACLNGGEFARFFGHLTPAAIQSLLGGLFLALGRPPGAFTAEELAGIETNLTAAFAADPQAMMGDDRARIDAIRNVRLLDDGRLLLLADGKIVLDGTGYLVLVQTGSGWRIDRLGQLGDVDLLGLGTGETAPPPPVVGGTVASASPVAPGTLPASRALAGIQRVVFHEVTAWTASPNTRAEEAPILSDDGSRVAFSRSPGSSDPADPNRVFVVNADGSGEREIDRFTPRCYCGTLLDISADGSRVVASDGVQLRVAETGGTDGRLLFTLASNELNAVRISGDGRTIVFRIYRDTTFLDTGEPIARGIYAIDPDGANLRLLAGPYTIAAAFDVPLEQVPAIGGSAGLDISYDGNRVVAVVFVAPEAGGAGQAMVAIEGLGAARPLLERVPFVQGLALSADGSTVAWVSVDAETNVTVAEAVAWSGGAPRRLLDSSGTPPLGINQGLTQSYERISLTADGAQLLLGGTGLLVDTASGRMLALSVADGVASADPPLIDGTLDIATMDAAGRRIAFLAPDAAGVLQLAIAEIDPAEAGAAPALSGLAVEPGSIGVNQTGNATITVALAGGGDPAALKVGVVVLRDGRSDPNVRTYGYPMADDGTSAGDTVAADGTYTLAGLVADCCAPPGPRVVRVQAESVDGDGRRSASTLDGALLEVTS